MFPAITLLDFVANAVLEWVLNHLIKWIEAHKLLAAVVGISIAAALFLLFR